MLFAAKTLGVDFINIFSTRWAGGEPGVFRDDFYATDGSAVARGFAENTENFLTGQLSPVQLLRG